MKFFCILPIAASFLIQACGSSAPTSGSTSGIWTGTRQMGVVSGRTYGDSIASDSSANVYVTGDTDHGLDGNTQAGFKDFFVTKYNSSGVKQWTSQLGVASGYTYGQSIASDSSANVYVTGNTDHGLDGNTQTGLYDFFVTKYNSSGVKQWTRQLGVASGNTQGYSIASDSSANVYVTGGTDHGLDGNTQTGVSDFFVTKYNSSGVKQWTRQLGVASGSTSGDSIASDSSANVYVTGSTTQGLDGNTQAGVYDFFVTKYNSSGVKQ